MVALEVLDLPKKTHDAQRGTNGSFAGSSRIAPASSSWTWGHTHALRTVARTDSVGVASWLVGFASSPLSVCGGDWR
jgi:hypothetical protein